MYQLITALCLFLCSFFTSAHHIVNEVGFFQQDRAAKAWFWAHQNKIEQLASEGKELIGLITKCDEHYHHTSEMVGNRFNVMSLKVDREGCEVVAIIHTHPKPPKGFKNNFLSKEDINTASFYQLDMYLGSYRTHDSTILTMERFAVDGTVNAI